ncbi:MAG: EAL domain-containing protein [Geminicoccaceae bacterium]
MMTRSPDTDRQERQPRAAMATATIVAMSVTIGIFIFELTSSLYDLQAEMPRFGVSVTLELSATQRGIIGLDHALDMIRHTGPRPATLDQLRRASDILFVRLKGFDGDHTINRIGNFPKLRTEADGIIDRIDRVFEEGTFDDMEGFDRLAADVDRLMVRFDSLYHRFANHTDLEVHEHQIKLSRMHQLVIWVIVLLLGVAAMAGFLISHRERVIERQRRAERLLAREQMRLEEAVESLNDGFVLFDKDDRLAICNQRYRDLYPRSAHLMKPGITFRDLIRLGIEAGEYSDAVDDPEGFLEMRMEAHGHADGRVVEQKLADGRTIRISERRTADGGIVGIRSDISEIRQREEALAVSEKRYRFLASYDTLTGLGNRAFFSDTVECMLETLPPDDGRTIVLLLDIDGFKEINDAFGHKTGDETLKIIANRLLSTMPDGGLAARVGADQFAVAVSSFGEVDALRRVADAVMKVFEDDVVIGDQRLVVSVTMGIAACPDHAEHADELLSRADLALYRAKQVSRGSWMIYDPEIGLQRALRRDLEVSIRRALHENEFDLALQPKLSLGDGEVCGVEALLRWFDPYRQQYVNPGEFIPVAESSNLILEIDRHVIREGCTRAMAFRDRYGCDLAIAVNLSGAHFRRAQLVGLVEDALAASGLPSHLLEIELTEGVLVHDRRLSESIIQRLHDIGVRIALDDFGTGYSSLAYLRDLPLDRLKIDRSFVMKIENSPRDQSIVRTFVNLGHELGMKVIAEGVETIRQMRYLHDIGCDDVQGYYIARPLIGEDFDNWMKNRSWLPMLEEMNAARQSPS